MHVNAQHKTQDTVNVLNLVEGEEAVVKSPTSAFEPFIVHYAETFIVPAAVGAYRILAYRSIWVVGRKIFNGLSLDSESCICDATRFNELTLPRETPLHLPLRAESR